MPIEVGFWKLKNNQIEKIEYTSIETEEKLEDILEKDISILSEDILLIGRQISTSYGKFIDMLGIDVEGNLIVIELKKDKTPRVVVAQTLDYASWVQDLSYEEVLSIFSENNNGKNIEEAFYEKFETSIPDKINESHNIIIVAAELDHETERIINYLSDNYNVPINAVFFRYFKEDKSEYLSRTWLIDPNEVEEKISKTSSKKKSEPWNGTDFVVNLEDDGVLRSWEDCRKYGFVSGGQGKWYSRTLKGLFPGARIFCMIPQKGYVGVGIVKERAVPVKDFKVEYNGEAKPILDVPTKAKEMDRNINDLDMCDYLVAVDWIETIDANEAYWEKGLKANQNTAFKLKSKYTIEKLVKFFNLDE